MPPGRGLPRAGFPGKNGRIRRTVGRGLDPAAPVPIRRAPYHIKYTPYKP